MSEEEIIQQIIENGKNPEDFNIEISENSYSIIPKWFYETKQIFEKEVLPIQGKDATTEETLNFILMNLF